MSGANLETEPAVELGPPTRWRRKRVLLSGAVLGALALVLAAAWLSRERIASNIVDSQLRAYDVPATYKIGRVTAQSQVLRDVVVGDPAHPELTADQIEVRLKYRFGSPQIGRVSLINPRLYGRLVGNRVSFGSLDKVIYRKTGKPPGLPRLDVAIRGGRALIRTDYGPVGASIEGAGPVYDGFDGTLGVSAPALAIAGCRAGGTTLYGKITTSAGKPRFAGPLRLTTLACPSRQIVLSRTAVDFDVTSNQTFAALQGRASISAGPLHYANYGANGAQVTLRGNWKNGLLDERHTIALRGAMTPQASAALLTLEGYLRASDGFSKLDFRSDVEANGLRAGPAFQRALGTLSRLGEGTLVAPLAQQFSFALKRQARGSSVSADLAMRRNAGITSLIVPRAEIRGGGGARILSLSRVEASFGGSALPQMAGNLATGGPDMPQITGRMERNAAGGTVFRLAMQPYSKGTSSLAVPQMSLVQAADGALGFSGRMLASGLLPGGVARGLSLPVSGRWTSNGTLSLWHDCVDIAFDRLQFAQLGLDRRGLRLCPTRGHAIVESGRASLRIAAGAPALDLAGTLGQTPIRLSSGPVGFAYPGVMAARSVDISLGPVATASRFTISNLLANLGGKDIAGSFDGADVRLASVPLDLRDASGKWRYGQGALALSDGDFRLLDRQQKARFEPLMARGGTLVLKDNVITAEAELRNPTSDRVVTNVALVHDLATARGHADLAVPGLRFDGQLQPEALSRRALGIVANANGTITGSGRIDWNGRGVTSTGDFSSDKLDFAAAFGPVKGAKGTVHFTDLIGLTTAPGQTLQIASVNPGIEVTDGEFTFQLKGGKLLAVEGGSWPFMGGRLILKRVDLNFGIKEARRYVFEIEGLDAAAFITRFQLPNVAATGLFDGTIPIVFDEAGNGKIIDGLLTSRPPGGNVSYVGDLTYEDLSSIANFAFDALRSLDYQQMTLALNGSLTGEIVTNVRFDGVKQGEGAKRNIVTRALANLPIQFRINIRAPFYQLITSFKSLRDPAAVRDPRDLGLLSDDGTRFLKPEVRGEDVKSQVKPEDIIPETKTSENQAAIQH